MHQLTFLPTWPGWQKAARQALERALPPGDVHWQELGTSQPTLDIFSESGAPAENTPKFRVPKAFPAIAKHVACHADPARWRVLYTVLWRLVHGEPRLLEIVSDADTHELLRMQKAVHHGIHKMRAFVRFREVQHGGVPWYVAWFEPDHHIIELNTPFFVDRFASMCWSILTPEKCVHWDGQQTSFTPGVPRSAAPTEDAVEGLWLEYYAHIFNPARVKVKTMQHHMPKHYWKNLPEADLIPGLLQEAPRRVASMIAKSEARTASVTGDWHSAEPPATADWDTLRIAALACTACPLYKNATQTVFGEGPRDADIVFLGEQPGDQEDRAGHPFIGPAGKLLDRALIEAGIDRDRCYVTNVVKHFKWEPQGKRRLHQTPNGRDIAACRPWMEAELGVLKPKTLVCLGGTAAKAVFGPATKVTEVRGQWKETEWSARTLVTVHPSSLLRAPDEATREEQYARFVADLRMALQ